LRVENRWVCTSPYARCQCRSGTTHGTPCRVELENVPEGVLHRCARERNILATASSRGRADPVDGRAMPAGML